MTKTITLKQSSFLKRWIHKLFYCPTFWRKKSLFQCPKCKKHFWCYWDGNDVEGHGTDFCNKCARKLEKQSENS